MTYIVVVNSAHSLYFAVPPGTNADQYAEELRGRYPDAELSRSLLPPEPPRRQPAGRSRYPRRRPAWTRNRR